ncbi:thiamine pyrophosphate-binding protein [Arthrobacter sp. 35W]|uniref:thiamine pyrophosphate-binding protein n=1 Tax=Arthrobacter sp. 35W TaxID=1132441 RepID=UPI00041AF1F5|nr:thiamine pyrophosphate-binding protein [Arthrobacter sp. 35W]
MSAPASVSEGLATGARVESAATFAAGLSAAARATVSDVVADVTARHSEVVFGLMGNGNAFFTSNLTRRGIRYISARHEAGTVAMADAYHRASGRVATATVTYGAGFTNSLTALAEAAMARIPLVLVVGDAPTTGPRPWDIDQRMVAAGLGVETITVDAGTARQRTEEAYAAALSGRRPVVLAIPYDLAAVEAGPQEAAPNALMYVVPAEPTARNGGADHAADAGSDGPAGLAGAAALLAGAERPLILAGRGAVLAGAGLELRALGDRLGALFATSVMARNLFDSPWDLGIAGGFATPPAVELMRSADVVLVVGAGLNTFQTRYGTLFAPGAAVVQIDELPAATSPVATHFVRADAAVAAAALMDLLTPEGEPRTGVLRGWRAQVPHVADGLRAAVVPAVEFAPDRRLNPPAVAQALDALLPAERTIVQDGGHFIGWMPMHAAVPDPAALMMVGTAFQTIGLGLPSAVGAAAARPDRFTVLVSGDGGALMGLADLETAVRSIPSGLVVVFNDAAYGAELHQYAVRGLDPAAMLIDEVDFSAVGRAMGASGVKMRSLADLDVLRDWLAGGARGLFILDVAISQTVVADYMRESMAGILAEQEN